MEISNINLQATTLTSLSREALRNDLPIKINLEYPGFNQESLDDAFLQVSEANKKEVVIDTHVFTIFKLPDGVLYTRVRDLSTGQVDYFPTLPDLFSVCAHKNSEHLCDIEG